MCLKIDMKWITRLPRHRDGVRDCIRVKRHGPPTEQGYLDWIKRFIHFHGKGHPPEVEACLWRLDRTVDLSLLAHEHQPMSAMESNALWTALAGQRPSSLNASGLIVDGRRTTQCGRSRLSEADGPHEGPPRGGAVPRALQRQLRL